MQRGKKWLGRGEGELRVCLLLDEDEGGYRAVVDFAPSKSMTWRIKIDCEKIAKML